MFLPTDITLQPGDSGQFVAEMQKRLVGCNTLPESNISGVFDGPTERAVLLVQAQSGLRQTGIADPATLRAISAGGSFTSDDTPEKEEEQAQEEAHERYENQMLMQEGVADDDDSYETDEEKEQEVSQEKELEKEIIVAQTKEALSAEQAAAARQHEHKQEREIELALEEEPQLDVGKAELEISQHGVEAKTTMDAIKEAEIVAKDITPADVAQKADKGIENPDKTPELKIDQEGMEARTPQQALDESSLIETAMGEQAAPAMAADSGLEDAIMAEAADVELPDQAHAQELSPPAPEQGMQAVQDPQLAATERQLDAPSVEQSRSEGQHLDAKGVLQGQEISQAELGELTPAQTPHVGREQQVGMGM